MFVAIPALLSGLIVLEAWRTNGRRLPHVTDDPIYLMLVVLWAVIAALFFLP